MTDAEHQRKRLRNRYRVAFAVTSISFILALVVHIRGERGALAPYNTFESLEAELFESMHELDPARAMHDEYDAERSRFVQELAEIDAEYDAIPDGTVLYRRTGSFITKEEYTNEEWGKLNVRRTTLEAERKEVLPSLRRRIVALRADEFHNIVSEIDLESLEFKDRLAAARAVSRSDEYLRFRQGLVDAGIKTDADGAMVYPDLTKHKVWLVVAAVMFFLSWFIGIAAI